VRSSKGLQGIKVLPPVLRLVGVVGASRMRLGDQLAVKFAVLPPHLDERQRLLLMAVEARVLGHGGVGAVAAKAMCRRFAEMKSS
ncbi:hypothetical protein, partial [Streptomyces maremycinicus]|uniref:hypothetical protein n=1 Tax=Streptomyces maremycinicus TaxID=1679753 RepID=UPI000AA6D0BA